MAVAALPDTQAAGQTLTLINAAVLGTLALATYRDLNGGEALAFNAMVVIILLQHHKSCCSYSWQVFWNGVAVASLMAAALCEPPHKSPAKPKTH